MAKKKAKSPPAVNSIRDRIKEFRRVRAGDLVPNPKNWRGHPPEQRAAMRSIFAEIGIAGAVLARELPDGRLMLIDGHLRSSEIDPDTMLPVLVLDVTEAEADKLLATIDPLAAMAETDQQKLSALLDTVDSTSVGLGELLDSLRGDTAEGDVELKPLSMKPPPAMTWVLIGIPTVRFGEIAGDVERVAAVNGTLVETTVAS